MKNLHKKVGVSVLTLLTISGTAFLCLPVIKSHANESATTDVNLSVGTVMSLELDTNSLNLGTTPNHFVSGTINATVSTNSQYGYTLTLEDSDNSADMTHSNASIEDAITSSFSDSKTTSEMEDNTWGFSLNTTDFYKVPVNGSPVAIKHITTPMTTASETTPITFGAKVGNIMSGTYTDQVLFTLYTNGQDSDCHGFYCISTMQEMTSEICENTPTPYIYSTEIAWEYDPSPLKVPRTVLTDVRDGNKYLVSKLPDGQCWMSQNLDLDLSTSVSLTSATTDLNSRSSWTPENNTQNDGAINDWNLGDWLPSLDPQEIAVYYNQARSFSPTGNLSYLRGGMSPSDTPTESTDAYLWEKTGNTYNFHAATAGSLPYHTPGDAADSICPSGWRLPKFRYVNYGEDMTANDYENFRNIYENDYDYNSSTPDDAFSDEYMEQWLSNRSNNYYFLASDPMNLSMEGIYYYWNDDENTYFNDYYWTGTDANESYDLSNGHYSSEAIAYRINIGGDDNLSDVNRNYGSYIRCIAR